MKKIWIPLIASAILNNSILAQVHKSAADNYFEISKNLELTSNIYKELNELYVDPIEPGKLLKASLDAMLQQLDPYTVYISESEIEDMQLLQAGQYGGIGISMFKHPNGNFVFEAPLENGPADKAGIKSGDVLLKIDGKPVDRLQIEQIGLLFRGAPNTTLNVEIAPSATPNKPSLKTIKRESIDIPSVQVSKLIGEKKDIGYVNLAQFTPDCARQIKQKLDSLKQANNGNLAGVVLDLRNNPGGLLDEAVKLCNLFIDKGTVVVTTKGQSPDWDKSFATTDQPWDTKIPLTILINNQSASASEIVSGTLQDVDRAVVIGQRSYGKGLVQVVKGIGYNAKLKITTAKYYTAAGRCIQSLDYTNKNPDGSVHSVPDSLKQMFKTSKGRKVYDGGGIEPDLILVNEQDASFLAALNASRLIFDYATQYVNKNTTIASPENFSLTDKDFDDFKAWVHNQNAKINLEADKKINELKELIAKDVYYANLLKNVNQIEQSLSQVRINLIDKNKKDILSILTHEILSRYYYETGVITHKLSKNDEMIKTALDVLENKKYINILK
jgi:carboxyl-terminal processing protease